MCDEDVILSLENLVLFCGLVNIQNDNQSAYVCRYKTDLYWTSLGGVNDLII